MTRKSKTSLYQKLFAWRLQNWKKIFNIHMQPLRNCNPKTWRSYLMAGEFLWEWGNLVFHRSKKEEPLAKEMLPWMKRESQIIWNGILLAVIYLDPPNRVMLSEETINAAKNTLLGITTRMKKPHIWSEKLWCCGDGISQFNPGDFGWWWIWGWVRRTSQQLERSRPKRARYDAKKFALTWMEKLRKEFHESGDWDMWSILQNTCGWTCLRKPGIFKSGEQTIIAIPPAQVSVERFFFHHWK